MPQSTPSTMAFSASVVQVSAAAIVLAVLFATATAAGANNGTVAASGHTNTAATAARRGGGNSTTALPGRQRRSNEYTCYLCHKRKRLMPKRCPITKDGCHVACVTLPTPSTRSPPPPVTARDADGCYVMKVYPDGSWVVVDVVSCRKAAPACYLTCNDGDEPGRDNGATAGTTPAPRGALPSLLADFERCGDHTTAQGTAVPAI